MYRSISDYAIIGDCHTAALISSDASIDWLCAPHFDSPAMFLRLLDSKRGGYCKVEPGELVRTSRRYLPRTNILETTFETSPGTLTVTDFMPVSPAVEQTREGRDIEDEDRIIRLLHCSRGKVDLTVEVFPTFEFATRTAKFHAAAGGISAVTDREKLVVQFPREFREQGGLLTSRMSLKAGDSVPFVLSWAKPSHRVEPLSLEEVQGRFNVTRAFWENWCKQFSYEGEFHDLVLRSALALKLMVFEPQGSIVAAPTTSLPEAVGGERNWDYRFCWLRDATFTLLALMNLGYYGEARDFLHFFKRVLGPHESRFNVLYGIQGETDIHEHNLPHLEGWRRSRPVRIGNAAAQQTQLDIFGEIIHCTYVFTSHEKQNLNRRVFRREIWPIVHAAANYVADHWTEPDKGIWEMRGAPRQFVYSKGTCYLALDRALTMAQEEGTPGNLSHWRRERDRLQDDFLQHGFNRDLGAFVQCYGSTDLDASVLRLPLMGVVDAQDPRMTSTVRRIEEQLMKNGLVYRYRMQDGLKGDEGTFTACGFWLAHNYALSGRVHQARELFQHITSFANDLGLLSEEIDPHSGEQIGNFPQAFTHISLVNAASGIAHAIAEPATVNAQSNNTATPTRKSA